MEQYSRYEYICVKKFTEEDLVEISSSKYKFSYPEKYNLIYFQINEIYEVIYNWHSLDDEGLLHTEVKKDGVSLGIVYSPIIDTLFTRIDSPLGISILRDIKIGEILD